NEPLISPTSSCPRNAWIGIPKTMVMTTSYPQHVVEQRHAVLDLRDREAGRDLAMLHQIEAVGDAPGKTEVLLYEQDRHAARLEFAQDLADALNNDWRQALGRLVEQQRPHARAQHSRDRQHLLFAARQ